MQHGSVLGMVDVLARKHVGNLPLQARPLRQVQEQLCGGRGRGEVRDCEPAVSQSQDGLPLLEN